MNAAGSSSAWWIGCRFAGAAGVDAHVQLVDGPLLEDLPRTGGGDRGCGPVEHRRARVPGRGDAECEPGDHDSRARRYEDPVGPAPACGFPVDRLDERAAVARQLLGKVGHFSSFSSEFRRRSARDTRRARRLRGRVELRGDVVVVVRLLLAHPQLERRPVRIGQRSDCSERIGRNREPLVDPLELRIIREPGHPELAARGCLDPPAAERVPVHVARDPVQPRACRAVCLVPEPPAVEPGPREDLGGHVRRRVPGPGPAPRME
jgi:hypothetical protein